MSARKKTRKNAGKGFGMMFHGNFKSKKEAKRKERESGGFMKRLSTPFGTRYMVMSERKNPIKRKKKAKTNPHELLVMGANPHASETHRGHQEITVPPGSTITIRMNPTEVVNPDRYSSAHAIAKGITRHAPGLIQTKKQRRVAGMVRGARKHKYEWIPPEGLAPGMNPIFVNPGDDMYMIQAAAELFGKALKDLSAGEMSKVAMRAAQLKRQQRRQNHRQNPSAAGIREDFTGMPVEHEHVRQEPHMPAGNYAQLGKLLSLCVKPRKGGQVREIKGARVLIVSDERARAEEGKLGPIWFVGGDQDVTEALSEFGAQLRTDGLYELGEAREIHYEQRKEHVPDPDQDHWRHPFGQETDERPTVLFDLQHKRLLLEGGAYEIRREGIVN